MIRIAIALALALSFGLLSQAQVPAQVPIRKDQDQPDLKIDDKAVRDVIEAAIKNLKEAYVFPETAAKMETDLRRRLETGEFDEITSAKKLATVLTDRLQGVSKDKHLRLHYSYDPLPEMPRRTEEKPDPRRQAEMRERMLERGRSINYGFEKVERLEGNIGYLQLNMFHPAEVGEAGETAAAAMNFLVNTDALIIDLRKNGGGAPTMVALLCTYLFDPHPVHLNDLYFRPEDSTHQWWTLPYVPGRRYEGKPVYVLTSQRTFSAAEEFTYNLKSLKRATIVGETTGGGAHPGGGRKIHEHFGMFLPTGRAINPITKTNWEGTGIAPDVPVAADLALPTAHLAALRQISKDLTERAKDSMKADPMRLDQVRRAIERLEKELGGKDAGKKVETGDQPSAKG
jgi:retinol-binding protein 3